MVEPTTALAMGFAKTLNKPLNDLYIYLKDNTKFYLDKNKLNEINKNLEEKIKNIRNVKTIYKGDEAIDLESFFFAPSIIINDNKVKKINSLDDFGSDNIIIEGGAGQGKSILMRYLAGKEFIEGDKIPIFIELRKINKEGDILQYIKESLTTWIFSVSDELLNWCLLSGKITLFLDGFDELKDQDVLNVIKELELICNKYSKTKIIISSRPENSIQASNFFKVVRIKPYNLNEQIGLIRILVEEQESFDTVVKALGNNPLDIKELLSTPLMVTLFVMTYRAKLTIPDSLSKFYQDLFSVLIYKHDRTKPGYQREFKCSLNENSLQEWFEVFCFISKNQKKLSFESRKELLDCIKESTKKGFQEQNPSSLLDDISKNLCLIIRDGNSYSFIHRSIQEFFAASFIRNRPEDLAEKAYSLIGKKAFQYRAEIKFLSEIDTYRYCRFLLVNTLNEFFHVYINDLVFINSFSINKEEYSHGDKSIELRYSGNPLLSFQGKQDVKEYLEIYLNDLFTLDRDSDCVERIMHLGGFIRFAHRYFLTEQDVTNDKLSKFYRKEKNEFHSSVYKLITQNFEYAKNLVKERNDQSFLDLI